MAADTLSRIFYALADPTRRDMVARLAEADTTVNRLAEPYQMTLQAVYKHLRVLEDAGVVSRPLGPQPRSVHLEEEVFDLIDKWIERYRRQAEEQHWPPTASRSTPSLQPARHEPDQRSSCQRQGPGRSGSGRRPPGAANR